MNISKINPYVRVAMQSVLPPKHRIPRRVIYDYELIYLERGEFTLIYGDKQNKCTEGSLILICPGIAHSFYLNHGEICQPHIHFDITHRFESEKIPVSFKDLPNMTEEEQGWIHPNYFPTNPTCPLISIKDKPSFLALFYEIVSNFGTNDSLLTKALMMQLLAVLIRDNFENVFEITPSYSVPQQIKDYIDAGNGFQFCLNDFSKQFSYSKFHLEKMFRKSFGVSLIDYRNQKRMTCANHLLKTRSVSETAEELGYHSIYSFSRAYKNYYGFPPSEKFRS